MPVKATPIITANETIPISPFVGENPHAPIAILIDVSGLTTAEVDINGYLKPGVPFLRTGLLVSAPGQVIYGVTVGFTKVAASNVAGVLAAAADVEVAVRGIGEVNRGIIESNLGRVLSADEIAAFSAAGSLLRLIA